MQYEIFRDVLVIVISVTAVLGAIIGGMIFFLLRTALIKDITTEVNKHLDKACRKLSGQTDVQAGVTYWLRGMYDYAISNTERALSDAGDVLDEKQIIFAKSNLGYYYAEKHKRQSTWHLKESAIALTKIGFEKYSPTITDFKQPDWIDNYAFARAIFAQTASEGEEIIELIDSLLLRTDLTTIHAYLEESKQYILGSELTS